MSTVGIVATSIVAALFLFVLLGCTAFNAWMAWNTKRHLAAAKKENDIVYAETGKLIVTFQAEVKASIESAKSGFSGIRSDMRTLLEEHRKEARATMEDTRERMQKGIDQINAEALQGAAARSVQACLRLEKVAMLLQSMMVDTEARATHEFGPEEFAPEENTFAPPPSGYGLSQTAQFDAQVDAEEVEAGARTN